MASYITADVVKGNNLIIIGTEPSAGNAANVLTRDLTTGEIQTVDLSTVQTTVDYIDYVPQDPSLGYNEGRVYYDDVKRAHILYNSSNICNPVNKVLLVGAINDTGGAIAKGKIVTAKGNTGDDLTFDYLDYSSYDDSRFVGVTAEDYASNGDFGHLIVFGALEGQDTSSWPTRTVLYADENGNLTSTRPIGPNFIVRIGTVIVQDASSGIIGIDPYVSEYTNETISEVGWANRSNITVTFTEATRTLNIKPTDNIEVRYYDDGQKRLIEGSSGQSVQIPDTTATYLFYLDGGVLTYASNPTDSQILGYLQNYPVVSAVYWRAGDKQILFGDLLHYSKGYGSKIIGLDYITTGSIYVDDGGLYLDAFDIDGNGSLDSHAQFSIIGGTIKDSDLIFETISYSSTTGVDILYRDSSLNWERDTNTGFSFLNTGTGLVAYQDPTTGGLVEAGNNTYVLYHIFVNNDFTQSDRVFSIAGTAAHGSILLAEDEADSENTLLRSLYPTNNIVPVAIVIIQTRNNYSNSVQARVVSTSDGSEYLDKRFSPGGGAITGNGVDQTVFSTDEFAVFDPTSLYELTHNLSNYTSNRIITWPNSSGTVVFSTDIANFFDKTTDDSDDITEGTTNLFNKIPAGGTVNQILVKQSGTDYDIAYEDQPESLPSGVQGNILYNNGSIWVVLPVGTIGQVLQTNGAGANPSWEDRYLAGHVIQDEGTPLTQRSNLNFVGSKITVTDDSGNNATVVTIVNELPSGTQGDIIYYNGAAWVVLSAGTAGYVLKTQGAGLNPAWAAESSGLPTPDQGDILYGNASNEWAKLSPGTSGQFLKTQGAGANPIWDDESALPSGVQGNIIYNNGSTWESLAVGTSGQVLQTNGAGANPSWENRNTAGHTIEDEGTPLTQRDNLNFVGPGVTVTDDTDTTLVTINAPQNKLDATSAPSSSNDNTEGYSVGSTWIDITNDNVYKCVDSTTAAAVWEWLNDKYEVFSFAASDYLTDLTTGQKDVFHWPYDFSLSSMFIGVATAPAGSTLIADLHDNSDTTIFTTKPSIDASEFTSLTAATPPVISTTSFTKGDKLLPYIDQVGATTAGTGLKFYLIGQRV